MRKQRVDSPLSQFENIKERKKYHLRNLNLNTETTAIIEKQ